MLARYLLPIAAAAMLGACGMKESYEVSNAQADRFHAALSAGRYEQIWTTAAPAFRKGTEKAQFMALMDAIGRKLGKVRTAERTGWNANKTNGLSTVALTYDTTFERGRGTETIVFQWLSSERLALYNYRIDSQDMMVN